jgi:hypothetical protein
MTTLIRIAILAIVMAWTAAEAYACDCSEAGCQRDSQGVCAAR